MSSRLVFLAFLGFALVQMSSAHKLRAHSTTDQWASVVNMTSQVATTMSDVAKIQTLIAQQTLAPIVNCFTGSDSNYASFGNAAGQFGTSDFSIDFWVQTTESSILNYDLIGNRYASALGNYLAVRMYGQALAGIAAAGAITVEICQDNTYNAYAFVNSQGGLNDGNWHHVGVVRQGTSLSLYIDGTLSKQGSSSSVTNISNNYDFRIGRSVMPGTVSGRFTGAMCYSGPRVERRAWSAQEIAAKYATTHP